METQPAVPIMREPLKTLDPIQVEVTGQLTLDEEQIRAFDDADCACELPVSQFVQTLYILSEHNM